MSRILIVDDEPAVLTVLRVLVTSMGHQAVTFPDADQALAALEAQEPCDLILSDLRMNPTSGFDLLKSVKQRWAPIPVILISGFLSPENLKEAKRLGAFTGLPKPFQAGLLKANINAALSGAPPQE